ncbi:hypothetical protein IAT38_004596 [Cryptococcus sp. DSM 104549]
MSSSPPPPPADAAAPADLPPPPTYAPSQPQILVVPLPDASSFFWGKTVQGEVFVKGLGEKRGRKVGVVKSLTVELQLTNHLPNCPDVSLYDFPSQQLYPLVSHSNISSSTPAADTTAPFPASHRFSIALPPSIPDAFPPSSAGPQPVPGTLNLSAYGRGEVRWSLVVSLVLPSGQTVVETMRIEGTPQVLSTTTEIAPPTEVEETITRSGVVARLLVSNASPALGDLLHLGVEIRPQSRQKTGVAGLSTQPDPGETLRPLRRVRVELFRRVRIAPTPSYPDAAGTATTSSAPAEDPTHLTLLHASGKSLRYPGTGRNRPPLRLLFTVPTAPITSAADPSWGEINMHTAYHAVTFFLCVTVGFGDGGASSTSSGPSTSADWVLQRDIQIRPRVWKEPTEVVIERGMEPAPGSADMCACTSASGSAGAAEGSCSVDLAGSMTDEELAREAYRQKGRDVVGAGGTVRQDQAMEEDLPPPFEQPPFAGEAGPSTSASTSSPEAESRREPGDNALPTFLESEEQMRVGDAPLVQDAVRSERLVPIDFSTAEGGGAGQDGSVGESDEDDALKVGRRASLGGELASWVEYDGYETFSVAPPPMNASYGAGGSMDPPQEGDDVTQSALSGMAARLGLEDGGVPRTMEGLELMEHLGLGEGTRVVDLQDDLPPGIDEPSLPALPSFNAHPRPHPQGYQDFSPLPHPASPPPPHATHPHQDTTSPPAHDPPSFDASQAASAVGGVAASSVRPRAGSTRRGAEEVAGVGPGVGVGEAPPGYDRGGGEGGLPPYSQG